MIYRQVKMEDRELLKFYKEGKRNFSHHRLYNRNIANSGSPAPFMIFPEKYGVNPCHD
ncbi:hypothetical protein [Aphanizomenon sp. UHCC 0183]|uniref:hypothetical protein n=1 Tax=Aphanizomenon sp. UHCC 0183 TaxID=2590028 RepID=UPI00144631CC|nr:hypothetical protein [Aphanizomenon sp. UHCC 0183]